MNENYLDIKAPVAWLPAGLISWYEPGGLPLGLVTSWVALFGGAQPRIRTAWHGDQDPLASAWSGGGFVLNVPEESHLIKISEVMRKGALCLNAETDLGYTCVTGAAAVAPRLLECAVQIECVGGKLVEAGLDVELCGDVVCVHRDQVVVNSVDIPDLCAIQPLSPLGAR